MGICSGPNEARPLSPCLLTPGGLLPQDGSLQCMFLHYIELLKVEFPYTRPPEWCGWYYGLELQPKSLPM